MRVYCIFTLCRAFTWQLQLSMQLNISYFQNSKLLTSNQRKEITRINIHPYSKSQFRLLLLFNGDSAEEKGKNLQDLFLILGFKMVTYIIRCQRNNHNVHIPMLWVIKFHHWYIASGTFKKTVKVLYLPYLSAVPLEPEIKLTKGYKRNILKKFKTFTSLQRGQVF